MDKTSTATCTLSFVPGRNIIKSEAAGVWTVKDADENRENVKKMAAQFKGAKWAFIPVVEKMAPIIDTETSNAFSRFHDDFQALGCIGFAFVVGPAVAIKAQAQRHHDTSTADKLVVSHFKNEAAALEWLKSLGV